MRSGKSGKLVRQVLFLLTLAIGIGSFALRPIQAEQIHRNGFEGRDISWSRGEDNVRAEEKVHKLSEEYRKSGASSEFIQLVCPDAKNDNNFVNYYYSTQPAPIGDDLVASVHVKANRAGIQLQARVVLPKERNPKQIDEPLTVVVNGEIYKQIRRWQKLEIPNPVKLLKDQQQLLRAQFQRDINLTDAYIDRLVLNLWTGPGQLDAYIDDLEIGPVKTLPTPPSRVTPKQAEGTPTGLPNSRPAKLLDKPGYAVRMERDRLFVDGKPFFFRAIHYSDTPLKTLRDAGFNTVLFPMNTPSEKIEEAPKHGFWIVPTLPLLGDLQPDARAALTSRNRNELAAARDYEGLAQSISRFITGDAVLFWDIGAAMQVEKADQLKQMADAISRVDPGRPRGCDVWDGFGTHSNFVELVGTHRYPLLTSLELTKYRDWLIQRRRLAKWNTLHWTWVQTHIPDWQTQVIYGRKGSDSFDEPIGPQPEQIRLLTYLGLATGVRGLAFSSDRFLADSHQGRDRLLMMAILNQEIQMLEPMLLTMQEVPTWIDTSHKDVKAAVIRCEGGVLVLPIWMGGGSQFVTAQGSVNDLTMVVPLVPDGAHPWEITPARVQSLQHNAERRLAGTRITIPEFDLTSAIVFTSDLTPKSNVIKWQNHSRLIAPQAAQWAIDLAAVEIQKVRKTHNRLVELSAPPVLNADDLLRQSMQRLESARRHGRDLDYANAYLEAMRALRPLRILMKYHWENVVRTLDVPSASPFAVSFYTLPHHWELHRSLGGALLGANALHDGDFESAFTHADFIPLPAKEAEMLERSSAEKDKSDEDSQSPYGTPSGAGPDGKTPKNGNSVRNPKMRKPARQIKDIGAPVTILQGWTVQQQTLDSVELQARLIPSAVARLEKPKKPKKKREPFQPSNGMNTDPIDPPEPKLGKVVLALEIRPKLILLEKDKAAPAPAALERTYLAVNTPMIRMQPGTWVRISGWMRAQSSILSSADGALLFDNVGGEGMGVRITEPDIWKEFHLYRKVPPSGAIWMTAALTGIGTVYLDDLKIVPLEKGPAKKEQ